MMTPTPALRSALVLAEKAPEGAWECHPALAYSICLPNGDFLDFSLIKEHSQDADLMYQAAIVACVNFVRTHGRALLAEREWRPIAEVPNDGTLVLLYVTGRIQIGRGDDWHAGAQWLEHATHWQPLPSPPEPSP